MHKIKTAHLDPDVVRSDSLRGKVMIVVGPRWDSGGPSWASGPGYYALKNPANTELTAVPRGVVERPADKLSSPPAVGLIRKEPHLTLTEAPAVSLPLSMDALTRRQRDVFSLIVQGRTNKEIARSLGLGEGTVKIHVAALFGKLRVHRRAAVAVAGARFLSPDHLKSA
jgi:DNA-binding NarL/FixJ family response regulator